MQAWYLKLFIYNLTLPLILGLLLLTLSVRAWSAQNSPYDSTHSPYQREAVPRHQSGQDRNSSYGSTLEQSRLLGSTDSSYSPDWDPSFREQGLDQSRYGTRTETDPYSDPYIDPYGKSYGYGY